MSSILDALKKIEAEKAQSHRVPVAESEAAAGAELLGKRGMPRSPGTARVSRARLLLSAATVVVVAGIMVMGAFVLAASRAKAREEIPSVARPIKPFGIVRVVKPEPAKAVAPPPAPQPEPPKAEVRREPEKPAEPAPPITPASAKVEAAKEQSVKTVVAPPAPQPAPAEKEVKPTEAPQADATKIAVARSDATALPKQREPKKELKEAAIQTSQGDSGPPPKKSKAAEGPKTQMPPAKGDTALAPKATPEKPLMIAKKEPVPIDGMDKASDGDGDAGGPAVTPPKRNAKAAPGATKESDAPVNIFAFPALKESDKTRLGLEKMKVNLVRTANATHPYAFAIINMKTVHLGETIPDSKVTLIAVEMRGIAIEVEGTGERFHVRF